MRSNHMTIQSRKTILGDSHQTQLKIGSIAGFFKRPVAFIASRSSNILLAVILVLSFLRVPASSAQSNQAFIRQIRLLAADETGLTNPAGLVFSAKGKAFHAAETRGQTTASFTDLVK